MKPLKEVKPKVCLTPLHGRDGARTLRCPRCRRCNLHPRHILAWVRDGEEGHFIPHRCDDCHGISELCLVHRDGVTHMFWRDPGTSAGPSATVHALHPEGGAS